MAGIKFKLTAAQWDQFDDAVGVLAQLLCVSVTGLRLRIIGVNGLYRKRGGSGYNLKVTTAAIEDAISQHPSWTIRQIAQHLGVSHQAIASRIKRNRILYVLKKVHRKRYRRKP